MTAVDEKQFEKLSGQADSLSPDQFKRLVQAYANGGGLDAGGAYGAAPFMLFQNKSPPHWASIGPARVVALSLSFTTAQSCRR